MSSGTNVCTLCGEPWAKCGCFDEHPKKQTARDDDMMASDNPLNDMLLPADVMHDICTRVYPHDVPGTKVIVKTPRQLLVPSKMDVGSDVPGGGAA